MITFMIMMSIYILSVLVTFGILLFVISGHQDVTRRIRREALVFCTIPIVNILIAIEIINFSSRYDATQDEVVIKRRNK